MGIYEIFFINLAISPTVAVSISVGYRSGFPLYIDQYVLLLKFWCSLRTTNNINDELLANIVL